MTSIDTPIPTVFAAASSRQSALRPSSLRPSSLRPSLPALARELPARAGRLLTLLLDWQDRARARRQLLGLGDAALKDFGASRADAEGEAARPFWQA